MVSSTINILNIPASLVSVAIPRISDPFHLDEGNFFDTFPGWTYVITLLFIDTSLNVIEIVQHVCSLLDPGGIWIDFGPLLWTSSGAALELNLDELVRVVQLAGFDLFLWRSAGRPWRRSSASIQAIPRR